MSNSTFILKFLFSALFLFFCIGPGHAETNTEQLKKQIQERSAKMQEFRALLNDPDQTVRLAALDTMLKSNDVAMREMAYGSCFNSADQAMRAICLKNKIADLKILNIKINDKPEATEVEKRTIKHWSGILSIPVNEYNEKIGQFNTTLQGGRGTCQLSGISLQLSSPLCDGSFMLADGAILKGLLSCKGGFNGEYPSEIKLH